jgi:hypothetical protein
MDGGEFIEKDTGKRVTKETMQQAIDEFGNRIGIIAAVENGTVTLNLQEYLHQPAAFSQARACWRSVIAKLRKNARNGNSK